MVFDLPDSYIWIGLSGIVQVVGYLIESFLRGRAIGNLVGLVVSR
jgi:hypothetical protein